MSSSPPGFSLWIGPPSKSSLFHDIKEVVHAYSKKLGTPEWQGHITLLGQVEDPIEDLTARLSDLCKNIKPFTVGLTDIVIKDQFFQCVMAKIEETSELMELNRKVQALFPGDRAPYWPHLSLVYGDLTQEQRLEVQQELRETKEWAIVGSRAEIKVIEIWSTEGPVSNWYKAGEVPLGQ
ncbi:hypothetical protein HDU97_000046 [Phlyctochytrium planicorne]|nr:hypothetical protein HDU97_000046 [Phlyctochytrium planicorne]